ncbi:hypothetical protein M501DRAFT_1003670 [Patellaria atrata CBS 101060]|uniref:Uncharacterized protein n=1 Tax=Patellaria atrata CBS 101060 TaxID=1346257 RepID=A0A9P4SAM2_9PEZI|nr:hypothetical protein M501DRAFT_1003670 [Patellaria atrata CBS 101060]
MTDEDNFDIDIYGDDTVQDYTNGNSNDAEMKQGAGASETLPEGSYNTTEITNSEKEDQTDHGNKDSAYESVQNTTTDGTSQIASTGGSTEGQYQPPKQAPIQQGTKRKEGSDDRPVDPNATTALLISELQWWTNEDDMRGWANQSGCEDELVDVTFNEHKVNGKSKG